jgi:hypothetical protein
LKLQQNAKSDTKWAQAYFNYWGPKRSAIEALPGYPKRVDYPSAEAYNAAINPWLYEHYPDVMQAYHDTARFIADYQLQASGQYARFDPGTARFDSALKSVTGTLFTDGGSKFYDRSALYHAQGEYKFTPGFADIVAGASYRLYTPKSLGNIFSDTGSSVIRNYEAGVYGGIEKRVWNDRLKLNVTLAHRQERKLRCTGVVGI